ncbi:MAG: ABC transporter permease subunit [Candidatus Thorarchaeota archaeon]
MKKAIIIMKKDLQEIIRNWQIFGVFIILPIVLGLLPPLMLLTMPLEAAPIIVSLFNSLFLIMAVIIPITVASDSFAGEKERKTIEALLAAPISDSELFLGKVLVSFVPAVLITYLSATLYCILINLIVQIFLLPNLPFLFIMILVPVFALFSIELIVFVSVRVKGFREAQQLAILCIIPVIVIIFLNFIGIPILFFPWNVLLLIGLIIIDIGFYGLAVKKFGRENIITRI